MDYHSLPRKDLQLLCKKHGIPANRTNVFMAEALAKKRIPLSDVSVNKDADNDLFSVTPLKVSTAKSKGDDGIAALFNNTPFLRRGTKKKEGGPPKSTDGTEEQVEVRAAAPLRGTKLFQDGGCGPIPDTATKVGAASLQKSSTLKDSSGSLKRDESKSGKSAKGTTASVKQKPEEKCSVQVKSTAGPLHQPETRRGGKSGILANGAKVANEKTEVKSSTSCAATTGALQQPDGSKIGACEPSAANAELVVKGIKGGKFSIPQNSTYVVFEQDGSDSSSFGTSEIRRSSSESSFTSADQEDLQPRKVEHSAKEAGFVNDAHKAQTYLGQDSNIEGNQHEETELGRPHTPPKESYIVKVTFADEVSIMSQGSGGAEKVRLVESMVRRSDTPSTTNGGYAVKSKLDYKPATNLPFVFRATRQEETKPKRSKSAARETSDLKGRAESKAFTVGALKQDESKPRRAGSSEGKEAVAFAKVKPEGKASAVPVSNTYLNPSKRPRLGSGSKLADDSKATVDKVPSSPIESKLEVADTFEFPASCPEEFKVLDLPEWAKEFKRKREDTLSSTSSVVAHTPDGSTNEEMAASLAPGLSPLKRIEDTVVKLLDRLKGFCWNAEVDGVTTEVASDEQVAVEEADEIEVDHTPNQQGKQTD